MRVLHWTLLAAVAAGAAGCSGEMRARDDRYYDRRPYAQPREVYAPAPAPLYAAPPQPVYQPQQVVVVREAPPPIRVERPGPRPGPGVIWVNGYWVRQGPQWQWVGGHWENPPRPNARWEEPRWEQAGVEFHFHAGGWR